MESFSGRATGQDAPWPARALMGLRAIALRAKDAAGAVAAYAADVVKFDLAPPLRYAGVDRAGLEDWYRSWQGPIGHEIRDLSVTASDEVAHAHSLNRITGTRSDGAETVLWFRETVSFQKVNGTWKITHEHNSVPLYMDGTDKAATDLKP